jgi:Sec-independent protein translocase protein TatA
MTMMLLIVVVALLVLGITKDGDVVKKKQAEVGCFGVP